MSLNGSPKWMYNAGADFYPYKINQSLRHNEQDDVSVDKNNWSSDASGTTWSFSAWVKRGDLTRRQYVFMWSDSRNVQEDIRFHEDDKLRWYCHNASGEGADHDLKTARVFRDNSAWYHILCVKDTTQSTASNRNKIYINGQQVTEFTTANYSSQNYASYVGLNHRAAVGGPSTTGSNTEHFDGYIAEVQFINGTALGPEYFGETKEGIWIPKESYSGSYGTNGFYLKYVAGSEGTDSSGNGNTFTLQTDNATRGRAVQDSPTNNFCVMPYSNNPTILAKEHQGMRLNTTRTGYWDGAYGSFAVKSGKWYYEVQMNETAGDAFRSIPGWKLAPEEAEIVFNRLGYSGDPLGVSNSQQLGNTGHYAYLPWTTQFVGNGGYTGTKAAASKGDVLNVAVDFDNNKIYFGLNGTYAANDGGTDGDPANGTNESLSGLLNNGKFYSPSVLLRNDNNAGSNSVRFNFGSDRSFGANLSLGTAYADENGFGEFRYSVPSGFLALCSQNLPDPAVDPNDGENPADFFNTVLYTGNGSSASDTQAISGVGFSPDFTWIKNRTNGAAHVLNDRVRGAGKNLFSNSNTTENISGNTGDLFASFDSDGFTVNYLYGGGTNNSANQNANNYVSWNWLAGGSPSSNGNGSITSSVSANTDAGFSIVSYTGTGSAATIGHGLSQAPDYIIVKNRDATDNWAVGTIPGNNFSNHLQLNDTDAQTSAAQVFGGTNPTSTVFSVGTNHKTNDTGEKYIAYCFHSVDGYSKIGIYEGNSNADGPIVNCGFRPAFMLFKNIEFAEIWVIYDNKRDIGNLVDLPLYPNLNNNESAASSRGVDFLSTGFKIRGTDTSVNRTGNAHVYLAFADQPIKYANGK